MSWCSDAKDGAQLAIVVQPRASRTAIVGEHGGALKIRLAAPPVDGAANDELVSFLAEALGVRRDAIEIRSGLTGRRKIILVRGFAASAILQRIGASIP